MTEPFVLVDPRMTVASARQRLTRYPDNVHVVLRRRERLHDSWYAWRRERFTSLLAEVPEETLLQDAIDFEAEKPQRTLDVDQAEPKEAERFRGVFLREGEAVGCRPIIRLPGGGISQYRGLEEPQDLPMAKSAVALSAMAAPLSFPAHPRLDAPRLVRPGERFELVVGLATLRSHDVFGGPLDIPIEPDGETFSLDVQVVADGFTAPEGWRRPLQGRVDTFQEAEARIPLIAPETLDEPFHLASLIVHFTHAGNTIGSAWRNILIRPQDAGELTPEERARLEEEKHLPLGPSLPGSAPDLTVRIDKADGNFARGGFTWTFETPHPVALPDSPIPMDLGEDARTFAKLVIDQIDQERGSPFLNGTLQNLGDYITEKVPTELWDLLRRVREEVRKTAEREVTLLLLSAESYIPWELASMPEPLREDRPPFLGAQVTMGRWILGRSGPPLPPREKVGVQTMAVVVGDYGHVARWRELPFAIEEGEALVNSYRALRLDAKAAELDALFEARLAKDGFPKGAEAVHFACHGQGNPTQLQSASIILVEPQGKPLSYIAVRATALGRDYSPFVFMNACQVGTAGDVLGQYAGFAGNFLKGGARGFLAPLWSVDDKVAHGFALDLYKKAYGGTPVAEIVREHRCRADLRPGELTESTYLSYIFYGHPNLILSNAGVKPDASDI